MDLESLKRVLTGIKGEARKMRKDEIKGRLDPALEADAKDGATMPDEGSPIEEAAESPDEALAEGDAPPDDSVPTSSSDEDMLKQILQKLAL